MAEPTQQYSEEAAKEILRRALEVESEESSGSFSRSQLHELGHELGLSEQALARAEQSWLAEQADAPMLRAKQEERLAFEGYRRANFHTHVAVYGAVNLFLFVLNMLLLFTGDTTIWFFWPLLGWGLGLTLHAISMRQNEGPAYEAEFQQWRLRQTEFKGLPKG